MFENIHFFAKTTCIVQNKGFTELWNIFTSILWTTWGISTIRLLFCVNLWQGIVLCCRLRVFLILQTPKPFGAKIWTKPSVGTAMVGRQRKYFPKKSSFKSFFEAGKDTFLWRRYSSAADPQLPRLETWKKLAKPAQNPSIWWFNRGWSCSAYSGGGEGRWQPSCHRHQQPRQGNRSQELDSEAGGK